VLHIVAAVAAVVVTGVLDRWSIGAHGAEVWVVGAIAVFWVVAFVNAFNFMDGIDGIAAGQALVAGLAWVAIGAALGDVALVVLGIVLAGASGGFLFLNWSPARIFMGDVGSAFLGFLIAVCPLVSDRPARAALPAALVVWPFLFDTAFTLVRRARRGENLLEAHRSHLYQRLTSTGRSHAHVAALYVGLALAGALAAYVIGTRGLSWIVPAVVMLSALGFVLWSLVVSRESRRTA
jgi:UDP-N-acetylmuramyl pentapeptide phosphotransferase/UDP-N-acetylglucosamine-1-phosphate transferase